MYIYIYYLILIGIILKFFEGKQITNNIVIQLTLIICIGIFIINLLLPSKNKEDFASTGVMGPIYGGKPKDRNCSYNTQCLSGCCKDTNGKCVINSDNAKICKDGL